MEISENINLPNASLKQTDDELLVKEKLQCMSGVLNGDLSPRQSRKQKKEKTLLELEQFYEKTKVFQGSKEIPQEIRKNIRRSGVIPYCVKYHNYHHIIIDPLVDDVVTNTSTSVSEQTPIIYFGVAIDSASGELTDCGGKMNEKEIIENTAARELYEESLGLFDIRKDCKSILSNSLCAINKDVCIFFVNISSITPNLTPKLDLSHFFSEDPLATTFQHSYHSLISRIKESNQNLPSKKKVKSLLENSLMYWIPHKEFKSLSQIRTRCVSKKGYHPSKIECSSPSLSKIMYEQLKSNIEESKRGGGKCVPSHDKMFHPLIYEIVRRIIYSSIDFIIDEITCHS